MVFLFLRRSSSGSGMPPRKRRYDDYDHGQHASYIDKRPRGDYRDDYRGGSRSYRDDYGSSYHDGSDDRHRSHRGEGSGYHGDDLDMDPRQAVNLLMGLTSMLK